jgi:diguanylate cyclase (GGDEF)-like protein
MWLTMACWLVATFSGLVWRRRYTVGLTLLTLAAFLWSAPGAIATPQGWLQLAALVLTPPLLGAQRVRDISTLNQLRDEEAQAVNRLSELSRSLLSLQQATQQTESQIAEITDLYHITKETSRALHVHELFTASLEVAPKLLTSSGLRLIDCSQETPQVWRAARSADGPMVQVNGEPITSFEKAVLEQLGTSREPASASGEELAASLPPGLSRIAWAPLWRDQQPVGALIADELPSNQLRTLSIVADQLSLQLSRIHLYQQVESLAVTDALTGVSVRGHFMERAREELARSVRHRLSCTLLMTDLDHFKKKNDMYGHLEGDVVLRDVARLLQRNLREIDMIARYGGEEFILLLIETDLDQAMPVAERLRQLVEVHPIRAYDELLTQTLSIGVAAFPSHATTLEGLIECADQALYAAKRAGRNQVVPWTPGIVRDRMKNSEDR